MSAAELTQAERESLLRAWPWPEEAATTRSGFTEVATAVEEILAARLASQEEFHKRLHAGILAQVRREMVDHAVGLINQYADLLDPSGDWPEGGFEDVTKAAGARHAALIVEGVAASTAMYQPRPVNEGSK